MKRYIHDQLVRWKNKKDRKPLLLKGARQVGKTYSLKAFGAEAFPAFHYLNFEEHKGIHTIFKQDFDPSRILNELSLYLHKQIDAKQDLLIFDEIQECPDAIASLKYFQEQEPGLAICAAGSLLGIHLGEGSFPVGYVEFLDMHPMCFEEFLSGVGEDQLFNLLNNLKLNKSISEIAHSRLWDQLKIYFVTGGLPEIVDGYRDNKDNLFESLKMVREKQRNLFLQYLADMAKHAGKQNSMHIGQTWRAVPAQLARELDGSAAKFKFKNVVPGIKRYDKLAGPINWLLNAGLIIKVSIVNSGQIPFSAYTKENTFKLFLFDIGMLGAISDLPPKAILDYDYGTYKGYFAENFVAQEFICSGVNELHSWAEKTAEVEFLREIDGDVLPVEVKSGGVTQAKSLKVFAKKYNPKYRTIMSAKGLQIDTKNKVHHYPLYLAYRFPLSS